MAKALIARIILVLGAMMIVAPEQAQAAERNGEQIVKGQCVKCHQSGEYGAPRIGDRAAWAPRMNKGVDSAVRSAIRGHGAMPSRGGMSDLTDTELRSAVLYMFNPDGTSAGAAPASPAETPDAHRKVVDGMEIYLGVVPADSKGAYRVNISLRDAATRAQIKDAAVEARVSSALTGTTKTLSPQTFNDSVSYVNDFRMTSREAYTITAQIRRPGIPRPAETTFVFRP